MPHFIVKYRTFYQVINWDGYKYESTEWKLHTNTFFATKDEAEDYIMKLPAGMEQFRIEYQGDRYGSLEI